MKPRSERNPDSPRQYLWKDLYREPKYPPQLVHRVPSLKDARRLAFLRAKAKHGPLNFAQDLELKVLEARKLVGR